ncbi:S-layer homology domain-containing protein [Paenibacillus sp. NFR01]|uniref:S-layer homology domain-containing protein n=1 Tax=Paenibacillus sp. NFR01 TaxID=1566279 RepID=UPI0008AD71A0|nr:S-layer homology domain-containing protein [Paenibacillus sp. NFR01]SEU13946.1 S-layer homology domain-containing protein [Paenibacillus sp. NFR01]
MQRIKRPFLWLVMAALLVSLFPVGMARPALAATPTVSTYFNPDNKALLATKSLRPDAVSTDSDYNAVKISRSNVYFTTNGSMTITGSYSLVTGSTIKVKVEQLTQDSATSTWKTDATHVTIGSVSLSTTNSISTFKTNGLTLYSGYNKITFSGEQGGLERSESFYVLFDNVPYVQYLKVLDAGPEPIVLNEGAQVVVSNNEITIQGGVANATSVTVSLNGGSEQNAPVLEDTSGKFFVTPLLTLASGINTIDFTVKTASDTIHISRSLYFFDTTQPFTDMQLSYDSSLIKAYNTTPTLTGSNTTDLIAQVLLPYSSSSQAFSTSTGAAGTATSVKIGTDTYPIQVQKLNNTDGTSDDEVIIPKPDGESPAYRLVKFKVSGIPLSAGSGQKFTLYVNYGNFSTSYTVKYNYLQNEVVITDLYYLPDYVSGADLTNVSKLPLDGAEVSTANFYISVKTNKAPTTGKDLSASYLPLSSQKVTLTQVASVTGSSDKERIYKVTGFSTGQQTIRFQYAGSTSYQNVLISYVSKNYIYVSNLQDGQTYTFNSKKTNTMTITGQYIGFESIDNAQYYINGIAGDQLKEGAALDGPDTKLGVYYTSATDNQTSFSLVLNIKAGGPIQYGENTFVFTGVSMDGAGNKREIRKEIRIYIVDENTSTLKVFRPATGTNRTSVHDDMTDAELVSFLKVSPEFVQQTGKFVTSEKSFDLLVQGSSANALNLYQGSQLIFSSKSITGMLGSAVTKSVGDTYSYTVDGVTNTFIYDFYGNEDSFVFRFRDFKFDAPGTQVFNLELVNSTGARSSQRLEIERVVSPYIILSPVPTVGSQIVVNKNFVRFDIEAEGATKVMIDKFEAKKRTDVDNRFVYDYVGLKPDKATTIKIQIVRSGTTLNDSVTVYYASAVQVDTQFMAEKVANKYTVFNKDLTLSFPKGTVMKGYTTTGAAKYYPDQKLLFGIADPRDGVVERYNDYGNLIGNVADARSTTGEIIQLPADLTSNFGNTNETKNFTRVSDIYWISGGLGESGTKQSTNGIPPYSLEGTYLRIPSDRLIVPSQRGDLTLSFNDSVVDEVGTTVTVFRYVESSGWENVGGSVDTKAHTITVPFDKFGYYTVMKLRRGFSDITNHPWARNILNALYSKGIMNYLQTDRFGADDLTTRGEFATLLVKGLNIPLNYDNSQQTFFDVVPNSSTLTWDFARIETAARAGIVTGLSDGFFGPDVSLTREQAAVMIARALKLKMNANNDKLLASLNKTFVDAGSSDFYSRPAIEAVSKAKIMEGSASTPTGSTKPVYSFNPKGKLTRAEAGKIAVALLQKSTNIFPKTFN